MQFWNRLIQRLRREPSIPNRLGLPNEDGLPRLEADVGYQKLEARKVLSATFAFGAGELLLSDFDSGSDLSLSQDDVDIDGRTVDAYVFELSSGSWMGTLPSNGVEVSSVNGGTNNLLEVATSVLNGASNSSISIDGSTSSAFNIDLTQVSSAFTVGSLEISNVTSVDSNLDLSIDGRVTLDNLSIVDSNPNDSITTPASIAIEATGDIDVVGDIRNEINHIDADVSIQSIGGVAGINGDVTILGKIETTAGTITVDSNDSILLGNDSQIVTGQTGDIHLTAGVDTIVDDDFSRIDFADGASVITQTGSVSLDTSTGGDILLGNIESGSSAVGISITSGGNVLDNTANESANLTAINGEISINAAGSVGGAPVSGANFFKATQGDYDSIETATREVIGTANSRFFVQELSTNNTEFAVDATTIFINSEGDLTYNNGSTTLTDLTLISSQTVFLPESLAVTNDLRIEGLTDVQTNSGVITLDANRLLFSSESDVEIQSTATQIDASANGDLTINNSIAVEFVDLNCDLISVFSDSNTGNISINSDSELTISDDVIAGVLDGTTSSGNISISGTAVRIDDVVITDDGNVLFNASSDIEFGASGASSTVGGNMELNADGPISMTDGSKLVLGRIEGAAFDPNSPTLILNSVASGGTTTLTAADNISISSIQTTNATTDAIRITSSRGSVNDGGDNETDLIAEQIGAMATITSALGVGDGNAIETSIVTLDASSLVSGNIEIDESTSIELFDLDTTDGSITVKANGNIQAVDVQSGENESVEDDLDSIHLESTNGSITTTRLVSADNVLLLAANGSIADTAVASLLANGTGTFAALDSIEFANSTTSNISVGEHTSFNANLIRIGQDGLPAGSASALNVDFGSLSLRADDAHISEDDSTLLEFSNRIQNDLALASGDSITNDSNATIIVGRQTQLTATNNVFLGNQTGDDVQFRSLGVVATNAHFELEQGVVLNADPTDLTPPVIPISLATNVDQTMYVRASGEIVQTEGDINARQLGLDADGHVHLESIGAFNETMAISAAAAANLPNNDLLNRITALDLIENSEVESSLDQSIEFFHQGDAVIDSITSATGDSSASVTGLTGMDGSIFISAADSIQINNDVVAVATMVAPQVTVYVENSTPNDPQIAFDQAEIRVSGGPQGNVGIVNSAQTTATFFDSEGFVFRGTTEFLVLNPDGSADQNIVLDFGHAGEEGYRVGVVWDLFSPEGNQDQPAEDINTYVANLSDPSEAYNDTIYQTNNNTTLLLGGVEGGRATIAKVDAYSKDAIINHQFDFRTFSVVTVRNDQNINLFAGAIDSIDNSLNESIETIRADLDSPKRFALPLPAINLINPIETRTVTDVAIQPLTPDDVTSSSFARDVQPFETGKLKWTRVKIPLNELESFENNIRLKDPTKDYGQAEGANEFRVDDEIGENEVEKIIKAIESEADAESGYWYKIFKDYRNRDDELFFYHLKSGEIPQPDTGPESDFSNHNTVPNDFSNFDDSPNEEDLNSRSESVPASDLEEIDANELPEENEAPILEIPSDTLPLESGNVKQSRTSSDYQTSAGASVGISASSLIIAGLALQRKESGHNNSKPRERKVTPEQIEGQTRLETKSIHRDKSQNPKLGFSRLDRIKRQVRLHFEKRH